MAAPTVNDNYKEIQLSSAKLGTDDIPSPFAYPKAEIDDMTPEFTKLPDGSVYAGWQSFVLSAISGGTIVLTASDDIPSVITTDLKAFVTKMSGDVMGSVSPDYILIEQDAITISGKEISIALQNTLTVDDSTTIAIFLVSTGSAPTIESVAVTPATLSLKVGASQTLAAAVKPDTAAQTVTWTSDKAAVATVDSAGKVTAVAAGTAVITATSTADTAKTAKCAVTVVADVTTPKIDSSVTIPANVDATQKTVAYTDAAAAAKEISCDIAATDIEVKDGAAVVKADTANAIITTALAENEVIDGVKPLPIFHVTTTKDVATALAYVKGSDLLAANVEDVTIFKLLSKTSAMEFEYTAKPAEFADGKFTILDDAGKVASGAIEAEKYYQVLLFIKDGGEFDMDGAKNGAVVDPAAVASVSEKSSGGSSSGCSAGVGVIALFAIAALPLWRKKK